MIFNKACEYPALQSVPTEVQLPIGFQAVLYEKENFKGNSVVFSAHDGAKTFPVAGTNLKNVGSLRVLSNITIVPASRRDNDMLDYATYGESGSGWLQKGMAKSAERTSWFSQAKFGCFVHWGVYAIAGGEWNGMKAFYSEHMERVAKISQADYQEHFIEKFNPMGFDADQWIRTAKDAGMEYFVITAKHHDGFAMYHSDAYPYDMRMTPYKADPIQALREACDKYNIKFGLYYSHAFDWEHPDAPGNDWEYTNGGGDLHLFEGELGLWFNQHPELVPRTAKYYVNGKSIPQIVELIKKYRPSLLWFDTSHKLPISENVRILQAIWETDDSVVVNGRLSRNHRFGHGADYANTGDRAAETFPTPGLWETIPTTNNSYGYSKVDFSHKPPAHFIELIIKSAARGGNVLMNLGPDANGEIAQVDLDILAEIGKWMKANGESIYGASRTPLPVQTFGETTVKDNKLYLHITKPVAEKIILGGALNYFNRVYMLADSAKTPLQTRHINQFDTEIFLPGDVEQFTVLVAEFVGELFPGDSRLLSDSGTNFLHAFDATYISPELAHGDGKPGNDHVNTFTSTEQSVIWKVRTNHKMACKLEVKYSTATADTEGQYSIYTGGTKHVGDISETTIFSVEIDGEKDIVFRPQKLDSEFLRLHGVQVTPIETTFAQEVHIEVDTTDLGG